jgi:SAM-dependent methyltransferase
MRMLKRVSRFLVNTVMLKRLPGPYSHAEGHCWRADLPRLAHLADGMVALCRSPLVVYEDGVPLPTAHARHEEIRTQGGGLFSHWDDQVLFSTTDNSDPNTNGRSYTYSTSPWLFRRRTPGGADTPASGETPVNFRQRDCSPEQMRADVEYALSNGLNHWRRLQKAFGRVEGLRVLEVGPGINFGPMLILGAFGMKPIVADRFLAPWQDGYHDVFYAALADALKKAEPGADVSLLRSLAKSGGYDRNVIGQVEAAMEELPLPASSVDAIFSNAVLEHLYDLDRSFRQLSRITRPGGFGHHQVDFRDHRHFDRPLEFLLLEENEFQRLYADTHGECGNRFRPHETQRFLCGAGFEVLDFNANMLCPPDYLAGFLPRLRAATRSRYQDLDLDLLEPISGCFRVRKPG